MSVSEEIKNKEKSLIDLMGRIFKDPLNPIEKSLIELTELVLNNQGKIEGAVDTLNALFGQVEDSEKKSKRNGSENAEMVQECVINNAEIVIKRFDQQDVVVKTVLHELSGVSDEIKNVTIEGLRIEKSISQHIENNHSDLIGILNQQGSVLVAGVAEHFNQQNDVVKAALAGLNQEFSEIKKVTTESLHLNSQQIESNHSDLIGILNQQGSVLVAGVAEHFNQQDEVVKTALAGLNQEFSEIKKVTAESSHLISQQIEGNQSFFMSALSKQNETLVVEISFCKSQLKKLTIVTSILFFVASFYIVYDMLSKFN